MSAMENNMDKISKEADAIISRHRQEISDFMNTHKDALAADPAEGSGLMAGIYSNVTTYAAMDMAQLLAAMSHLLKPVAARRMRDKMKSNLSKSFTSTYNKHKT